MAKAKNNYGLLLDQQKSYKDIIEYNFKVPTGSLIFDVFLDGGYKSGVFRFGAPPEHGKTLQCLTWIKHWFEKFGDKAKIYYFDAEGRLTPEKVKASGLREYLDKNPKHEENFKIFVYNVYEDIANFVYDTIMKDDDNSRFYFVFDSLDMMISQHDLSKGFEDAAKIGAATTISTKLLQKIGPFMGSRGHHLHILSQLRANINTSNPNSPKTQMSGGNAIKHGSVLIGEIAKNWSDMWIYENPTAQSKEEKGKVIGHYHTIKFSKTPNEKSNQTIRIPILYGRGIWREREVLDLMLAYGLISKGGAWYTLEKTDFKEDIEKYVTEKQRNDYVESKLKELEDDKNLSKKEKENALKTFQEEAEEKINFELKTTWQGMNNVSNYFDENKHLVDYLENELRSVLINNEDD